jgi:hypothetical protein
MLSGEARHTNFLVFGLIQPGLEPTIYHTRGEHITHQCGKKYITLVYMKRKLNSDGSTIPQTSTK